MSDMGMHPDFYPCTNVTHWKPLQDAAPDVIGEFMFMYATVDGVFAYKNSITREYAFLDDQGRGHLDGRSVPAVEAVAAARDGMEFMAMSRGPWREFRALIATELVGLAIRIDIKAVYELAVWMVREHEGKR